MRKKIFILIILFLLILVVGCGEEKELKIIGSNNLELGFEETYKLFSGSVELDSESAYWTSSDRTIALCNNGIIKPLKEGVCDITAVLKSDGTKVATTTITITDALIKAVEIYSREGFSLYVDDVLLLDYKIQPENVNVEMVWSSSDESIAIVDDTGCVTGKSVGRTTIRLQSGKAVSEVEVVVKERVTELQMTSSNNAIVGQSFKMSFNVEDAIVTLEDNDGIIERIGNYYFARKVGTVKAKVSSKSLSSLKNEFEIHVYDGTSMEKQCNKMHVNSNVDTTIVKNTANTLSDVQKLGQMMVMNTSLNSVKEDDDGLYFTDTVSGRIQKVYLVDFYENKFFGNYHFSSINGVDDSKETLNLYYKYAFATNTIGSLNIVNASRLNYQGYFSYKINNKGIGNLAQNQVETYYQNIATQLKELGYNIIIEDGYTSYNELGVFKKDNIENNYYSTLARKSYEKLGIMVGYDVDYLEDYNKTAQCLINLVNNDVDFIQIEYNASDFSDGKSTIEYLRDVLQYEGIIYLNTDYYNFAYEDDEVGLAYDYYLNAILQGADLINVPLSLSTSRWYRDGFNEIVLPMCDRLINEYTSNDKLKQRIDESVERIITKKYEYKCIEATEISENDIDHSATNRTVSTILKSSYEVSEGFKKIEKDNNFIVFGYQFNTGSYYDGGRIQYNFVKNVQESFGKDYKLTAYSDYYNGYESYKDSYDVNDQVVILLNSEYYTYSYDSGHGRVYDSMNLINMIKDIYKLGVTNIQVIVIGSPSIEASLPDYVEVIQTNSSYTIGFSEIIDILKNGK